MKLQETQAQRHKRKKRLSLQLEKTQKPQVELEEWIVSLVYCLFCQCSQAVSEEKSKLFWMW